MKHHWFKKLNAHKKIKVDKADIIKETDNAVLVNFDYKYDVPGSKWIPKSKIKIKKDYIIIDYL